MKSLAKSSVARTGPPKKQTEDRFKPSAFTGSIAVLALAAMLSFQTMPSFASPTGETVSYSNARRIEFDNGFIALIYPSRHAKTVSCYLGVRAGAADEGQWLGMGLSHFVEHMFFKGTARRDKGQIEKEVREIGGTINAFTSQDMTVFYLHCLSSRAETGLDILHDAAFHPTLDPKELESERQVILSEQRMNEDQLDRKALLGLWDLGFDPHPYRHPVIGYPERFKASTREDLAAFLKEFYTPNNMVLSVVGDVDSKQVEEWVKKSFGAELRGKDLYRPEPSAVSRSTPRSRKIHAVAEHTRFLIGFPTVSLTHEDAVALDVLSDILGGGASSRLVERIEEAREEVLDMGSMNATLRDAGLFTISSLIVPGSSEKVRQWIWEEIDDVRTKGISEAELRRSKTQVKNHYFGTWESHDSLAQDMLVGEMYARNYAFSKEYLAAVEAVTVDEVRAVALRYLQPRQASVFELAPKTEQEAAVSDMRSWDAPTITRIQLPNGVTLLLGEDRRTPTVAIQAAMDAGALFEPSSLRGISVLTSDLLQKGTATHDRESLNALFADWGGELATYHGQNSMGIALSVLSEHTDDAVRLMCEVLKEPAFAESEFTKVLKHQKEELKAQTEDIYTVAQQALAKNLYGNHPYAANPLGTDETLARITRKDVTKFYTELLKPSRLVIGVFGDIDKEAVLKRIRQEMGALSDPGTPKLSYPPFQESQKFLPVRTHVDKEQSVVLLAVHAVRATDPDRYALEMINAAMTGSAGRLYQRVRSDLGLAYSVGSSLVVGRDPGYFGLYAGLEPGKETVVENEFKAALTKLREEGIEGEEFQLAKIQILGIHEQSLESKMSLLHRAVHDELAGLGYDHLFRYREIIERLQTEDVNRVIDRYIHPERSVQITLISKGEAHEAR